MGLSAAQASVPSSVSQPFTLLGPFRWREADSGLPIVWYKNTSAPNPLVSGDAVSEIQTALSAWTTPASASIILQYGGTTFQSDADGPWTGIPTNTGVITFEDPDNELSGSTLAIGGGWSGGASSTVNGTSFGGFSRGYVIFRKAAELEALAPSFRQSLNFSRVLQHEIGHAIGLGHTQTDGSIPNAASNIMYPSCCQSGVTPVPPALGPDDLNGLTFVYPVTGPACTFSLSPTSASWGAAGGSGSATVSTQPGCAWSASSSASFLNISSGSAGTGSGTVNYSVASSSAFSSRTGTLTIAGQTFTVTQAAGCGYALTPSSASVPAAGGTGSVTVTTPAGCPWSAVSNASFANITSSTTGSGNGSISYQVSGNGISPRTGTLTIAAQTFTINQFGTGPIVTLDKPSLRYGATHSGTIVTSQTSAQLVRLSQTAGAAVTWTATSNQPWLIVSPTSGSGDRDLSITVATSGMTAPATATGSITLSLNGAGNTVAPIAVTVALIATGTSANSIGVVDTPLNNATGVTGAVPFTGWVLDDVEVANVFICRAPVAGESAPIDPNCGGAAQIIVGAGVFIDGTRPDVQAAFPLYPRSSRAGWGFMVLTNMLPAQGNGVFVFHAYATDRDGHIQLLGSRTLTCDNANSTTPFGTIDTPGQGDTAAGASYVNFGWALTQQPKFIPQDGSTITVFVDGVPVGSPSYNHYRSDIATLFPGLANSNGAVGFRTINTTALSNGLHTIVWTASDSAGVTGGIGSRFFHVSNASGAMTAAAEASRGSAALASMDRVADLPLDQAPLKVRRGWAADAPWRVYSSRTSRTVVRGEELDRFEIALGDGSDSYRGYLRVGNKLESLPVGSRLDAGTFTWSPGLGFVGAYDLVFVRGRVGAAVGRQEVRIVLHAKGSGHVGPQGVIDTPTSVQEVTQPFLVAGWAIDLGAAQGTGVELLHMWAYPLTGGAPTFLGAASYAGARPDVAAVHGEQFRDSGYGLTVQGLPPGGYDVAVFAWSTVTGDFVPAKLVRVVVR
jgi:hypothetical protein